MFRTCLFAVAAAAKTTPRANGSRTLLESIKKRSPHGGTLHFCLPKNYNILARKSQEKLCLLAKFG